MKNKTRFITIYQNEIADNLCGEFNFGQILINLKHNARLNQ